MKPPFLNGSSRPVRLRVPSGKIRNELPAADRCGAGLDRPHRRFLVPPVDRDEAAQPERARQERNRVDLVLVEDVHPRVQRVEQHRRIDVALMVRAVDRRAVERQVLGARRRGSGCRSRPAPAARPPWPRTYRRSFQPKSSASSMPGGADDRGRRGKRRRRWRAERTAAMITRRGIINEKARQCVSRTGGLS